MGIRGRDMSAAESLYKTIYGFAQMFAATMF